MKKRNQPRSVLRLAVLAAAYLFSSFTGTPSQSPNQNVAKPELVIQTGHSLGVNCVVFGPDRRWLASGGADKSIRLWDLDSGLELRALIGHQSLIRSLAVSDNGELLASGSSDHTVKVWNVSSGRLILTLPGHASAVDTVLFSPDGRQIVSGGSDTAIKVWDAESGQPLQTLKDHTAAITALAVSPDGKSLASGSADGKIMIWSTPDWKAQRILKGQTKQIGRLVFSPDSRTLASGGAENELVLWDVARAKPRATIKVAPVTASFVSDSELLTTTVDGTIASWDPATGKRRNIVAGSADAPETVFATFSRDGKFLAASSGNRSIEVYAVADGKLARTLASHSAAFFSVAFSRDGGWLASGANDHSIRLWQTTTGTEMPRLSGHNGWVQALAFSPNKRELASGSNSGEIKIWDLNTGREVYGQTYAGDRIHAVALSDDEKWLAAAGTGQTIYLADLATKQTRKLSGHADEITSLAFIPNTSLIVSGSTDKTIRLWDTNNGTPVKTITLDDQVNALAMNADGSLLAAGTAEKRIELFQVNAGVPGSRRTLTGHTGEIFKLAFSPDGLWLASTGQDGTVRIWDPKTGNEAGRLAAGPGEINGVDFSSDSHFLAAASSDGSIVLWDTQTASVAAVMASVPNSDDWLVVTPVGLFDGSPAAWKLLLWRFAQNTFKAAPVEAFYNDFYYPGLLAEILAGKQLTAGENISQKDRRQITVKLTTPDSIQPTQATASRTMTVQVEVTEAPAGPDISEMTKQLPPSGARDVRLFRNGSLVKLWSGDVFTLGEKDNCKLQPQASSQSPRRNVCKATIPVVAGPNEFIAYAFNQDNIKSQDSTLTVTGSDSLKRAGTLYVLAVGVNQYQNKAFDLTYAVPDAEDFGAELKRQQDKLKNYERTEIIPLYNAHATRETILGALKDLSRSVQPEDAVVVYFAGHGTIGSCLSETAPQVNAKDRFYLVPHDLGYQGPIPDRCEQKMLDEVARHSISDLELEAAFEKIDAGQLLLVVDACNSGQALESEEKRRGPMNSKGLAQLAYEKGMYILTAAQSLQEAKADKKVAKGHGYLTYALVEEGLKTKIAANADGNVTLREWVDYAVKRVPGMQQAEAVERRQFVKKQSGKPVTSDEEIQTPRVFYRREPDLKPLIVARP